MTVRSNCLLGGWHDGGSSCALCFTSVHEAELRLLQPSTPMAGRLRALAR